MGLEKNRFFLLLLATHAARLCGKKAERLRIGHGKNAGFLLLFLANHEAMLRGERAENESLRIRRGKRTKFPRTCFF